MPTTTQHSTSSRNRAPVADPRKATSLQRNAPASMAREPLLVRAYARAESPAAALVRADPRARARIVGELQRSHGNVYVQRAIAATRRPSVKVRIQRCGGTSCNCSSEEHATHAMRSMASVFQRLPELDVASELTSGRAGEPLHPIARRELEPAMGLDLGHVRVHTDQRADHLARAVDAEAFTTGDDIYFQAGRYDPHSKAGLRLIAHEATHTAQQARGAVSGPQGFGGVQINEPGDHHEQEAERAADAAIARLGANPPERSASKPPMPSTRLSRASKGPFIQRSPQPAKTSGPLSVIYDPSASLQDNTGATKAVDFASGQLKQSIAVTPGTNGFIVFPVRMNWTRTSGGGATPPGPTPAPKPNPALSTGCRIATVLSSPIPGVNQIITAICTGAQDPCKVIDSINDVQLCALAALFGLGVGGVACAVLVAVGAGEVIRDQLKNIFGLSQQCQGGGTQPPAPIVDQGKGDARIQINYIAQPDGKLKFFPTPMRVESEGIGAEVVQPVGFTVNETPGGGTLAIAPSVRGSAQITRPNGESLAVTNVITSMFELDAILPPPPAPEPFCHGNRVFPFITGKDKFQDEAGAQADLFAWFQTFDPRVKQAVFAGKLPVAVIGHASALGNAAFNMELSEKRAKRGEQLMKNFGGSFSGVNTFAFGELLDPNTDPNSNTAEERRVDYKVAGKIAPPAPIPPSGDEAGPCLNPFVPPGADGVVVGGAPADAAIGEAAPDVVGA